MTFTNIKKRIASNIGYVDSSGDIIASRDITETDIGNWVNDRYLNELFPMLSNRYPEDFAQVGKMNFYKVAGTASAASTSTTLVASSNIFNNGMVGDSVYNSTDGEKAKITAYTSATTVTLDTTIGDTWDGDTIYVLGYEFGLGGNATDLRNITRVSVKYDEDADYYTTCTYQNKNKAFFAGNETYHESDPIFYMTTVKISDTPTTAIGILPEASEKVANGVQIEYVESPSELSAEGDTPRIPLGSQNLLVLGGTADALRKIMRLDEADRFEQKYMLGRNEMVSNYALTRASSTPKITPSRRLKSMYDRDI